MPKRSAEERILRYQKKIKKLQEKTSTLIESDAYSSAEYQDEEIPPQVEYTLDTNSEIVDIPTVEIPSETSELNPNEISDVHEQLDPNFLQALGDNDIEEPEFGAKIHDDLAKRWLPLLKKGLPKETKDKLSKDYLIPENLKFLQAPSLNTELNTALAENVRSRDKKLKNNQQQLSTGITAANRALQVLLSNGDKVEAIRHLSNCCRVLLDLHALETKWRRILVTTSLDKSFYQIVHDSERDDTLFGADLSEKVKNSKNSEKLGLQFKKPHPPNKTTTVQPSTSRPLNQGNAYRPRPYASRGGRGGPRRTAPAQAPRRAPAPSTANRPPAYPSNSRPRAPTHR